MKRMKSTCFRRQEQLDRNYSYPLKASEVKQFCMPQMPETLKWVIGTGPEGMILVEGLFPERQIQSGYAYEKLIEDLEPKGYMSIDDLEWYCAEKIIRLRYTHWLTYHPSVICPIIDLLGRRKFTLMKKADFQSKGTYLMRVRVSDSDKGISDKIMLEERIADYGGMLGVWYAHNEVFRRTNYLLEQTKFEHISWEPYGENVCTGAVYFQKWITMNDYVHVCFQLEENRHASVKESGNLFSESKQNLPSNKD